jgi:hypothetical protein
VAVAMDDAFQPTFAGWVFGIAQTWYGAGTQGPRCASCICLREQSWFK